MHTRPRTTPRVIGSPESDAHQGGHHGLPRRPGWRPFRFPAQVAEPLGVEQVGNHRPHHHKSQGEENPHGGVEGGAEVPLVMNREPMPAMRKV